MNGDELEEIRSLFLQECSENVDTLERGLLAMGDGQGDRETVDEVFRAAHSIKGGGATFGFDALSQLTHHMETYLDRLRSGQGSDAAAIDVMLAAVDGLRQMLDSTDPDAHAAFPQLNELMTSLANLSAQSDTAQSADEPVGESEVLVWHIRFEPKQEIAQRGNDVYLVLRELSELGQMSVTLDKSALPEFDGFDEKRLYLHFFIELTTNAGEDKIKEVFEWVEFDSDVHLERQPVEESEPEAPSPAVAEQPKSKSSGDGSMRIATEKIDRILDLVGELVITQSMLSGALIQGSVPEQFTQNVEQLERNIRELQESVMRVRMLPIAFAFSRLPRIVRDLSQRLGKQVNLELVGENTELDKTVLDHIIDPLVHLTRNAIDHGLEMPEARLAAGKPERGTLTISAHHMSGAIVIEIADDGQGINTEKVLGLAVERGLVAKDAQLSEDEIAQLIFAPGFSTADEVTDVSGRGVGMDVVRRNIVELGGKVEVSSHRGSGSKITIQLPLTLAILDGQLIRVGDQVFVVPIINIVETLELREVRVSSIPDVGTVAEFRDRCVPLVYLSEHVLTGTPDDASERLVLVVESHGKTVGLVIGSVLGQQQVVIKTLEDNFRKLWGVSGASIMSNGDVALILDVTAYVSLKPVKAVA